MAGRFPTVRPRRLRGTERLRRLVRETRLAPEQLVLPLFVVPGRGKAVDVPSMPGVKQWSVDRVSEAGSRPIAAQWVAITSHLWRYQSMSSRWPPKFVASP